MYLLLTAASFKESRSLHQKDILISLGSLYQLDAGMADLLRPWMVLKETDQLSGFADGRVPTPLMLVQGILSQGEYQVHTTLCIFFRSS